MELPAIKDKVLAYLVDSENKGKLTSRDIKHRLSLPIEIVNAALLELQKDGFIVITETTNTKLPNSTHVRSWVVDKLEPAAYIFQKNKTFKRKAFWDKMKAFLKDYWVAIPFLFTVGFSFYQIYANTANRETIQRQQKQIERLRDSLRTLNKN
jgi:hypothetical protein